jgi:hypothetical protein
MGFSLSTITGAAVTGLTSPTYTVTADTPPANNGKQYAVTALGGTQTGVDSHSVSKPFTISAFRPSQLKTLPGVNAGTGLLKNVPVNTYKFICRKGAQPSANQVALVPRITVTIDVPAGTDTYEPEEIKAMISAMFGALWAGADGIATTVTSGIL